MTLCIHHICINLAITLHIPRKQITKIIIHCFRNELCSGHPHRYLMSCIFLLLKTSDVNGMHSLVSFAHHTYTIIVRTSSQSFRKSNLNVLVKSFDSQMTSFSQFVEPMKWNKWISVFWVYHPVDYGNMFEEHITVTFVNCKCLIPRFHNSQPCC